MMNQAIVPLLVAIAVGILAHLLSARRDRLNQKREKKIAYLIEAYRQLESCAHRLGSEEEKKLESAVADIQLFGSPSQVKLVQAFVREFSATQAGSLDQLLQDLRRDLRRELRLEEVPLHILHLRFNMRK
jgi:hypothetical protein